MFRPASVLTLAVFASPGLAQDVGQKALAALQRTDAFACIIEDDMAMIVVQRDGSGVLHGVGEWSEWLIAEWEDTVSFISGPTVFQIKDGIVAMVSNGEVTQGRCIDASEQLQDWIGAAFGLPEGTDMAEAADRLVIWSRAHGLPGLTALAVTADVRELAAEAARTSSSMKAIRCRFRSQS